MVSYVCLCKEKRLWNVTKSWMELYCYFWGWESPVVWMLNLMYIFVVAIYVPEVFGCWKKIYLLEAMVLSCPGLIPVECVGEADGGVVIISACRLSEIQIGLSRKKEQLDGQNYFHLHVCDKGMLMICMCGKGGGHTQTK